MRSVEQYVVLGIGTAFLHFLYLLPDAVHGSHEVVQLCKAFAFGRLYHQRAMHGEGEGGSVVAIVHQAFGDIVLRNARLGLYIAALQNHLMSHVAVRATVDHTVGVIEAGGQVVGVEDGNFRGACQSFGSHHADIAVGDGQDAGTAPRCGSHFVRVVAEKSVSGQKRNQMRSHADGAYAGTASAVR